MDTENQTVIVTDDRRINTAAIRTCYGAAH